MTKSAKHVHKTSAGPHDGAAPPGEGGPKPGLGLWDAVSIIVGIVIGAGIFQTAPFILLQTGGPVEALLLWAFAGALSLAGALCYAELATTYPREGGDVVYLSRAFGDWLGFLFGWVQLTVILTGSIGAMAFIFANYAIRLSRAGFGLDLGVFAAFAFAGGAVLVLTVTNVAGVVFGKTVQNVLTVAKLLGLLAIVAAGFSAPLAGAWSAPPPAAAGAGFTPSLGLALVLILYTYGGWNDAAFVAAEVRDGRRNITRALVFGILVITAAYLLVNAAYVNCLGFAGASHSDQIAADVLNRALGSAGETLMCVLVIVSSLGAVNGLIFTGARVYSKVGRDYPVLSWMAGWSRANGAPVPALVTQGVLALALLFLVGTTAGQEGFNWLLDKTAVGSRPVEVKAAGGAGGVEKVYLFDLKPMRWDDGGSNTDPAARLASGGFTTLVTCTAPVFWLFFLMTGLSVFVLRERDHAVERPFTVPWYPELPLLFCLTCGYMLYSSLDYAVARRGWQGGLFLLGVLPLLVGLVLYRLSPARAHGHAR